MRMHVLLLVIQHTKCSAGAPAFFVCGYGHSNCHLTSLGRVEEGGERWSSFVWFCGRTRHIQQLCDISTTDVGMKKTHIPSTFLSSEHCVILIYLPSGYRLGVIRLSQVVNAISGAFKNGYFSCIYALENPRILSIIISVILDFMVWISHQDIPLSNELSVGFIIKTMVVMVTMATMELSIL